MGQQVASRTLSKIILSENEHKFANLIVSKLAGDKLKHFVLQMHGGYVVAALVKVTDVKSRLMSFMDDVRASNESGCKFLTGVIDGVFKN